jgi:hypothetical protein
MLARRLFIPASATDEAACFGALYRSGQVLLTHLDPAKRRSAPDLEHHHFS